MIKLKFIAAFACLSLAAACSPMDDPAVGNGNGAVAVEQPGPVAEAPLGVVAGDPKDATRCGLAAGTLADERALFTAETAYNVPAHAFVTFDRAGRLPVALKASVRPLLVRSYAYLQAARSAYRLGDVCSLASAVAGARQLADSAKALLPQN